MNIQIEYTPLSTDDTVDITGYVLSYSRDQKICSSIGTLEVDVVPEILDTLDLAPWDKVVLYEEGHKKGTYLVGDFGAQNPDGRYVLFCQDYSKKLQDYFIAETYLIDYPSTARYWLELFLGQAQVEYVFDVEETDFGSLLSNNTSLGLQQAYDQVINLLQISGWYMYFNKNGIAHIGKLTHDIGDVDYTLEKTDIIDIKLNKHDKMLRNRVVVWGNGDPTTGDWVFADISTTTPWNYNSDDVRSVVIANSNISSSYAAYNIAEMALTEFARITKEKWITAEGQRDIEIGDFVFVKSNVFRGIGVVTTIGSELDTGGGLRTIVILDERCPRLFAFYDFGDYVYIGTDGSGVWRKHIRDSDYWEEYNTGLTDYYVTDMYKNNNILSIVTQSGGAYLNLEASWFPVTIPELTFSGVSMDNVAISGVVSSGIMARAVAQDRTTNIVKLGVDNAVGNNLPYYDGMFYRHSYLVMNPTTISGYAWLLDVNEVGAVEAQYQVTVSGTTNSGMSNFVMFDVENDGVYDYVSVATSGLIFPFNDSNDFGEGPSSFNITGFFGNSLVPLDANIVEVFEDHIFDSETEVAVDNIASWTGAGPINYYVYDRDDTKEFWYCGKTSVTRKVLFWNGGGYEFTSTTKTYSTTDTIFSLKRIDADNCVIYYYSTSGGSISVSYRSVNMTSGATSTTLIGSYSVGGGAVGDYLDFADKTHFLIDAGTATASVVAPTDRYIYTYELFYVVVDKINNTISGASLHSGSGSAGFRMFPNGEGNVQISGMSIEAYNQVGTSAPFYFDVDIVGIFGPVDNIQETALYTATHQEYYGGGAFPNDSAGGGPSGQTSESTYCMFISYDGFFVNTGDRMHFKGNKNGWDSSTTLFSDYEHSYHHQIPFDTDDYYIKDQFPVFQAGQHFGIVRTVIGGVTMFRYVHPDDFTDLGEVSLPGCKTLEVFPNADSNDGSIIMRVQRLSDNQVFVFGVRNGIAIKTLEDYNTGGTVAITPYPQRNLGNFFWRPNTQGSSLGVMWYYAHSMEPIAGVEYFVMVKNQDNEFIPILSGNMPFRLDASNFPLAVAQDLLYKTQYVYSYPNEVIITSAGISELGYMGDMREYPTEVSGVFNKYFIASSLNNLDRGTIPEPTTLSTFYTFSGGLNQIETSNFSLPGQYVFATSSGTPPVFLQKDPDTDFFNDFSTGLPGVRITRIRLDDML